MIQNCDIHGGFTHAISASGDYVQQVKVLNNRIYDNRQCGINENRAGKASDWMIDGNSIYRCNTSGNSDGTNASGIYVTSSRHTIRGNKIGQLANETTYYGIALNSTCVGVRLIGNDVLGLDSSIAAYAAFKNGHGSLVAYGLRTLQVGNHVTAGLTAIAATTTPMLTKISLNPVGAEIVEFHASAAPTTGTWVVGDRVINSVPTVGAAKAWSVTVAGTPGTWTSEGNL